MNSSIFNMFRDSHAVEDSVGGDGVDIDLFGVDNEFADYDWMVFRRSNGLSCVLSKQEIINEQKRILKKCFRP